VSTGSTAPVVMGIELCAAVEQHQTSHRFDGYVKADIGEVAAWDPQSVSNNMVGWVQLIQILVSRHDRRSFTKASFLHSQGGHVCAGRYAP
jgi:hypothetical protein